MAVVWKEIAYKDDLDSHASQHGVGGSDSIFPADPDADRYLMWDDDPGELVWAGGASALDDLTDVTISGPADLDILQYDNGSSKWVDRTLAEAGIAADTALTASAVITDHAIVRGDGGTRGTQDTGITIDDSDNVVLPATSSLKCPEKLVIPLDQPTSLENGCIWIA